MASILETLKNSVSSTSKTQDEVILKDLLNTNPEFILSKLRSNSYILANEEFNIPNYKAFLVTDKYNNSGEKLIFSAGDERVLLTVNSLSLYNRETMDFDVYVNGKLLYKEDYLEETSKHGRNFYIRKTKFSTNDIVNIIVKDKINNEAKYKIITIASNQYDDIVEVIPRTELGNFYNNPDYLLLFKSNGTLFKELIKDKDYFINVQNDYVRLVIDYDIIDEESIFILQNTLSYYEMENVISNVIFNTNSIKLSRGVQDPFDKDNYLTLPLPVVSEFALEVFLDGYKLIPTLDYALDDRDGLAVQFVNVPKDNAKVRINTIPFHKLNVEKTLFDTIKDPIFLEGVIADSEPLYQIDTFIKQEIDIDLEVIPVSNVPYDLSYYEVFVSRLLVNKKNLIGIDNAGFAIFNNPYSEKMIFRNTLIFNDEVIELINKFKASSLYLNSIFKKKVTETNEAYDTRMDSLKNAIKTNIISNYQPNKRGGINQELFFKYSNLYIQGIDLQLKNTYFIKYENISNAYTVYLIYNLNGTNINVDISGFCTVEGLDSSSITLIEEEGRNAYTTFINNDYMQFVGSFSYEIVRSKLIDITIECDNPVIFAGLETPKYRVIGSYEDFSRKDLTNDPHISVTLPTLNEGEHGPIVAIYDFNGLHYEDYYYVYAKSIKDYEYLAINGNVPTFFIDNITNNKGIINPHILSKNTGIHFPSSFTPKIETTLAVGNFNKYSDVSVGHTFPNLYFDSGQPFKVSTNINTFISNYIFKDTSYINSNNDIISLSSSLFNPVPDSTKAKYIDIVNEEGISIIMGLKNFTVRRFFCPNCKNYLSQNLNILVFDKDRKIINSYAGKINYLGTI